VHAEGEYGTLALAPSAREVLRGEVSACCCACRPSRRRARRAQRGPAAPRRRPPPAPPRPLDAQGQRPAAPALKAWRAEVAREHSAAGLRGVPRRHARAEMARECPQTLGTRWPAIGGVGSQEAAGLRRGDPAGAEPPRLTDWPAASPTPAPATCQPL
jgi:ATP-dependent DNA helicase RecQ